jgi:pyridoxine 4-dehydrogenase
MSTTANLILPRMGCGTWAWGNRLLWGYEKSMDSQLQAVFNLCVNKEVTLFDTGDSYPSSVTLRDFLLIKDFQR